MAIKIFFCAFGLFLSTVILSEESSAPNCEDLSIKVNSTYVDYQYDRKTMKLKSKDLAMGALEPIWSNETREMKEVFFKYSKESQKADSVEIIYERIKDKKILEKKTYQLISSEDGLLKVKNFLFENGVQKPKDRPGIQTYVFKKNKKPVCKQIVKHFYASEAQ